jgi:hypothetical protein
MVSAQHEANGLSFLCTEFLKFYEFDQFGVSTTSSWDSECGADWFAICAARWFDQRDRERSREAWSIGDGRMSALSKGAAVYTNDATKQD